MGLDHAMARCLSNLSRQWRDLGVLPALSSLINHSTLPSWLLQFGECAGQTLTKSFCFTPFVQRRPISLQDVVVPLTLCFSF